MCSVEQDDASGEVDAGEKIAGELVVACGDGAVVLEFVEEPLDEVALCVEGEVAGALDGAIGLGRDDRCDSPSGQGVDQVIGVVSLVGEQSLKVDVLDQRLGLAEVRSLARRQQQLDRVAQSIDEGVDLGGQSAAGSADGLLAVFFRAPALC